MAFDIPSVIRVQEDEGIDTSDTDDDDLSLSLQLFPLPLLCFNHASNL